MAARTRRVVSTESARQALDEVIAYISRDSPDNAVGVLTRALDTAASLTTFAHFFMALVTSRNGGASSRRSCELDSVPLPTGCPTVDATATRQVDIDREELTMFPITRREFCGTLLILGTPARKLFSATSLDEILRTGIAQRKIPTAVAMVATADRITYAGAFGKRDSASGPNLTANAIFAIASMTKAVTSVAALQLVERGRVKLDEPVGRHLPQLAKLEILRGFDKVTGKPILRPASKPVTLRHLLTHTSGFAYPTWSGDMLKYTQQTAPIPPGTVPLAPTPLLFEPGTRWQYGYSTDWTGRLVEAVSRQTLDQYFQSNILGPLGMIDTAYSVPPEKFDRLVSTHQRQSDGSLSEDPRTLPARPEIVNGGGGLYSTAGDYVRFMQMILRGGRGSGQDQILQPKTLEMMTSNQTGSLSAGKMKTFQPDRSSDVDFHPGFIDRFGLGFLINTTAYPGGRSAGSLAWAGIRNTFYWIDPGRGLCAVLLMHFLPFCDPDAMGLLHDFEIGVYGDLTA